MNWDWSGFFAVLVAFNSESRHLLGGAQRQSGKGKSRPYSRNIPRDQMVQAFQKLVTAKLQFLSNFNACLCQATRSCDADELWGDQLPA